MNPYALLQSVTRELLTLGTELKHPLCDTTLIDTTSLSALCTAPLAFFIHEIATGAAIEKTGRSITIEFHTTSTSPRVLTLV
jgi:hypothetical protein